MNGAVIVSLIALSGSLVLALGNLRAQNLSFETKSWMAVAWLLIISVVAFIASQFTA
jgi:hypothetical protein